MLRVIVIITHKSNIAVLFYSQIEVNGLLQDIFICNVLCKTKYHIQASIVAVVFVPILSADDIQWRKWSDRCVLG